MSNLVFDADDTLWENNVLYERAVDAFIAHLAHPTLGRVEVRARLDAIEEVNCRRFGYGVDGFERSLGDCLAELRDGAPVTQEDREALRTACAPIRANVVELIDGVEPTLAELGTRHRLFVLTKGNAEHQAAKVEASGLAGHFADVAIVAEKHVGTYKEFVAHRGLDVADTWMIGNSPASDVLPALEAGLGAVYVPHPVTWSLESAELPEAHERFREVAALSALAGMF